MDGEEFDASTLKRVLSRCLEDSEFDKISTPRRTTFFRTFTDHPPLTELELDQIVSSLIERLGTDDDAPSSDDQDSDDPEINQEHLTQATTHPKGCLGDMCLGPVKLGRKFKSSSGISVLFSRRAHLPSTRTPRQTPCFTQRLNPLVPQFC